MKHVKKPKKQTKKKQTKKTKQQRRMENAVQLFLSERVIASNGIKLQREKWTNAHISDSVD